MPQNQNFPDNITDRDSEKFGNTEGKKEKTELHNQGSETSRIN